MAENKSGKSKKLTGVLAVALAATLLIGGGTFAYLEDISDSKVNTFNTNQVKIEIDETENDYEILPGTSQDKDPNVTVNATTASYVFVRVTENNTKDLVEYSIADGWIALDGYSNVYYRVYDPDTDDTNNFDILADSTVYYPEDITNEDLENYEYGDIKLTFTSWAIQKDPFASAADAFAEVVGTYTELSDNATVTDLQNAIDDIETDGTIVLTSEIETAESIEIASDKQVTLYLDGEAAIVGTSKKTATIDNSGDLNIVGGTIDATAHQSAAITNEVGATADLDGVTLTRSEDKGEGTASNSNSYYVVLNYGTMTLTDCIVSQNGATYSSAIENGWADSSKNTTGATATLTINGGQYSDGKNTVKNDEFGILVINDGTFTNDYQHTIMNYNIATINGGTITSTKSAAVYNASYDAATSKGVLTITGGTFNSNYVYDIYSTDLTNGVVTPTVTITDGTFSTDAICNTEYSTEITE